MHRFPQSVDEISKAINDIDKRFVTIQTMTELRNLFPFKEYEDEVKDQVVYIIIIKSPLSILLQMKKMLEFKGDPSELTEAEATLHGVSCLHV